MSFGLFHFPYFYLISDENIGFGELSGEQIGEHHHIRKSYSILC